ncbi:MAG: hypothetical protein E6929_10805 [Clostridium sp.]|nr:hypothetical protein [Clostridium sp.]
MKSLSLLRFIQVIFCFPIIIIFATYKMNKPEQIIFIVLFTLYTLSYEVILLAISKKRRRTTNNSSS